METGKSAMDGSLSLDERKRSMKNITLDGMAYSVMAGVGDAYLPAALVMLGASNFYIGLLAALPQLLGAALQFASLSVLRAFKNRKLIVAACSVVQALTWLPIILLVLWPGDLSIQLIIAAFSIGFGASLMANPIWSSWVTDIVPENERAGFFANRNKLMQAMLFAATFGAGFLIRTLELQYSVGIAFAAVFVIPFLARMSTAWFHLRTRNIEYELKLASEIRLKDLFLLPAYKKEVWFLAFVALMNFTVQLSAPFFTPYMLNQLGFNVEMLGILTAISIITKILCFPYWGRAIDRFSNRIVLIATAFAVPFIPLLWLLSPDPFMLAIFQVFSGFVWAGYDLAVFNSALSLVGRELRPSFISKYNAFGAFANALGAIAGGAFLAGMGSAAYFGYSGILLIFLVSGVLRLAVAVLFSPNLSGSREIHNTTEDRAVIFKLVAVYPTHGAVMQVANGWDFTKKIMRDSTQTSGIALREGLEATGEIVREGGRRLMSRISRKGRL